MNPARNLYYRWLFGIPEAAHGDEGDLPMRPLGRRTSMLRVP